MRWIPTAGSFDGAIGTVNVKKKRLAALWKEHTDKVVQATFVPYTTGIVSCGVDRVVKLWSPRHHRSKNPEHNQTDPGGKHWDPISRLKRTSKDASIFNASM